MSFSHYNQSMKIAKSGIKELLSDTDRFFLFVMSLFFLNKD